MIPIAVAKRCVRVNGKWRVSSKVSTRDSRIFRTEKYPF